MGHEEVFFRCAQAGWSELGLRRTERRTTDEHTYDDKNKVVECGEEQCHMTTSYMVLLPLTALPLSKSNKLRTHHYGDLRGGGRTDERTNNTRTKSGRRYTSVGEVRRRDPARHTISFPGAAEIYMSVPAQQQQQPSSV